MPDQPGPTETPFEDAYAAVNERLAERGYKV